MAQEKEALTPQTNEIYLALGSNLGDRRHTLDSAIEAISSRIGQVIATSSIYETWPLLLPGQPANDDQKYLNAVVMCKSSLSPQAVLATAHEIEASLGLIRREKQYWGPRIIDIDILLFGAQVINQDGLQIPHPRMMERDFVLKPLNEIAPNFIHPILNKSISLLTAEYENGAGVRYIIGKVG